MSDAMKLIQNEDGTFSAYDDTYDVVIHCETEEKQKKVIERLESTNWIPVSEIVEDEEKIKDAINLVRTFAKFPDRTALTDAFIESLKLLTDTVESQMGEVK